MKTIVKHITRIHLGIIILLLLPNGMVYGENPPTAKSEKILYFFDLEKYLTQKIDNKTWQYDVLNLVATLQGIVNRERPQLYILYVRESLSGYQMNVDQFWLNQLRGFRGYFADYRLVEILTVEELLQKFRSYFTGLVLWDPKEPATGNVALTVCGVDGLLPVRHDTTEGSLYNQIAVSGPKIPTGLRLTDKFPAAGKIPDTKLDSWLTHKGDTYLWAKTLYLDEKLCSPTYMAFMLDPYDWDARAEGVQYPDLQNCMVVNHDFYIAQRAFFLDLDPWWDEIATDIRPEAHLQGVDERILNLILQSAYNNTIEGERILRIGGFVPWWIKYSNYNNGKGKHTPEETAEEFIATLSAFNGVIDADSSPFGAMANASVFQHIPRRERYMQNPVPPRHALEDKNYILLVIGDFRSSAQLYQTIPILWQDPGRGRIPLAWAINPMLSERAPHIFEYLYSTRSAHDFFVGGSTGAGVCFLNRFIPPRKYSDLGDGITFLEPWVKSLYHQFDLHITAAADLDRESSGFAVFLAPLQKAIKHFSPQGVTTMKPFWDPLYDKVVPFIEENQNFRESNVPIDAVVEQIYKNSRAGKRTFQVYRFNLVGPTVLNYIAQKIQRDKPEFSFEIVDPITFFYLLRESLSKDEKINSIIPTFISNTIPNEMKLDTPYPAQVTLRNDGWDVWNDTGAPPDQRCRLIYHWLYEGEEKSIPGRHAAYINGPVPPGKETVLDVMIQAPEKPGLYQLILHLEQEKVRVSTIEERIRIVIQ